MSEITEEHREEIAALFVQTAAGFSSDRDAVTLHGLSPSTLYFSDRSTREVGHVSSQRFVDLWDEGEKSFREAPPNAVLSLLEQAAALPEDAVVVLVDPRLAGDALTYTVDALEGDLPAESGPCTLFIDTFGRPLTPGSAAGIDRRDRRRRRRRF